MVSLPESLGGAELTLGDEVIELARTRKRRGTLRGYVSARFIPPLEPVTMRLAPARPDPEANIEIGIQYWRQ